LENQISDLHHSLDWADNSLDRLKTQTLEYKKKYYGTSLPASKWHRLAVPGPIHDDTPAQLRMTL
jgi:hypothetical protein